MNLMSSVFLLFFIIFLLCYFLLPKKIQPYVLLVFSLIFLFCNSFNIYILIEVLLVILSSYIGGLLVEKYKGTKKSGLCCFFSVLIILVELILLKYSNFVIGIINGIFGLSIKFVYFDFPVGISYFSLIMISYLIDVYRDTIKCEKNIFKLVNFMSYFPLLTSGPFIRYNECGNEISKEHKFNINNFIFGISRILFGLFKVLVISNRLNIFINVVYGNLNLFNGLIVFISCLLYVFELYTNFSGCIDIVIGISVIIGVNLPENFDSPFSSRSMSEFWRRWHITLGAWLKEYILYPLLKSSFIQKMIKICTGLFGKKIGKKIPTYFSLFILWFAIGLWHGGEYKYILASGLIQFVYIMFEEIFGELVSKINNKLHINEDSKIYNVYLMIRTYLLFSFAMIFFRATSIGHGIEIVKSIFNFNIVNNFKLIDLSLFDYSVIGIGCLLVLIFDMNKEKIINKYCKFRDEYKLIIILLFVLVNLLFGVYGIGFDHNSFIYGSF